MKSDAFITAMVVWFTELCRHALAHVAMSSWWPVHLSGERWQRSETRVVLWGSAQI